MVGFDWGHDHHPQDSIDDLQGVLVAGFGSGHLRLFSLPSGRLLAEIAAHNGWITGPSNADADILSMLTAH